MPGRDPFAPVPRHPVDPATARLIAGVAYRFAGWLTSTPEPIPVGQGEDAAPLAERVRGWLASLGISESVEPDFCLGSLNDPPKAFDPTELLDALYDAWVVIANVGDGAWERESPEWRAAAVHWRDQFHRLLGDRVDTSLTNSWHNPPPLRKLACGPSAPRP